MELYVNGPVKTLAVETSSVSLLAADMKPTSGKFADMVVEKATIQAVGALYVETGGSDATSASFPIAAGDSITIEGYGNIKNLRFIKNVTDTSLVWIPSYR
jgi:hypothetical protein